MKKIINFVIVFFLAVSVSNGQFSASFQAFLEESMTFIEEEVDPVGLSISVRSGEHEWNGVIGISSVEDNLTTASIFAMGSITKTFISAKILQLMEEGQLTLNDPLHLYLPSFEHIDSMVTIKELLNHTSGIYDYSFHPEYYPTLAIETNQFYRYSPEEVMEQFVLEKVFDRGARQEYSNTNYLLLGMIITEITKTPYYQAIFETFNIAQNYPSISCPPFNSEVSELANLWADFGNGYENIFESGIGLDGLFSAVGASGAFVSSAADLSQWGYDLYAGNLLSASSMDLLYNFNPLMPDLGLGIFNYDMECGVNAVGHGGAIFYGSDLTFSEELDLSVAVMTNDNTETDFSEIGGFFSITEEIFCAYRELLVTSSTEISRQADIKIYPNPAQDVVTIQLPPTFNQAIQIEVYNEIGALVYAQELEQHHQSTLAIKAFGQLADGLYLVRVFDKENAYSAKLIKRNSEK